MGKVTSFEIAWLDLRFFSLDHGPPHFHAIKTGEWDIRVFFTTCTTDHLDYNMKWPKTSAKSSGGPTSSECRQILGQVLIHRIALQAEWDAKVQLN